MASVEISLAEFITNRLRFLAESEAQIQADAAAKISKIAEERTLLERAAAAAGISFSVEFALSEEKLPSNAASKESGLLALRSRRRNGAMTMKEAVVEVLRDAGHGLTALEILPLINQKIGTEYERTSLSPQLTRLKSEGVIERDGIVWTLVKQVSSRASVFE